MGAPVRGACALAWRKAAPLQQPAMFRNVFMSDVLSLFFSLGSKPLQLWQRFDGPDALAQQ